VAEKVFRRYSKNYCSQQWLAFL